MLRERISRLLPGALLLLLICGILWLWFALERSCVIRGITGIPCPCCGLSRAWMAVLRLDFAAAFHYHPMFWSIPIFLLMLLFNGQLFQRRWVNRLILAVLLGGMAVCYAVRIVGFLCGVYIV